MAIQKTKSIQNIEERMMDLEPGSFRFKTLECAKTFKSSWIELGLYLGSIYKDKMYKEWGYLTFEAYCAKEIGIRRTTAMKLLKSYLFLEKEEPSFLKKETVEDKKPGQIPGYEAVNALRLAKESRTLPEKEYKQLREDVLENPKEESEVKKKIKYVLKSYAPPPSEEDKIEQKSAVVKRTLSSLKNTKSALEALELPKKVMRHLDELIDMISEYQE